MTRFGWTVLHSLLALILLGSAGAYWATHRAPAAAPAHMAAAPEQQVNPSQLSIYSSGEYGFSFVYPASAAVSDSFSTSTSAVIPWRTHAVAAGTPIVRVVTALGEVRVGVSSSTEEISGCAKSGSSETAETPVSIASTTWKRFSSQKLGTDQEWRVMSYRTLHDSRCYALELLTPLAQQATSTGYTLENTVTSFTFAH